MNSLETSMSHLDGDPSILPFSVIPSQIPGRPNFACGQVKSNTELGQRIMDIARNPEYKTYLEIGTWCGLGTTKCFLDSIFLREDESKLISLESNLQFYDITKRYWEKFIEVHELNPNKFDLKYGSLIPYKDLDECFVTDAGFTKDTYDYNADIKLAPTISITKNIDVLCLDGGHFSTQLEWDLFKNTVKVLVLDDTNTSKTRSIISEAENSGAWDTLYSSQNRNGEMILKKKKHCL